MEQRQRGCSHRCIGSRNCSRKGQYMQWLFRFFKKRILKELKVRIVSLPGSIDVQLEFVGVEIFRKSWKWKDAGVASTTTHLDLTG